MHGLSKDVDLSFLLGKKLAQFRCARDILILWFDEQIEISIESRVYYHDRLGISVIFDNYFIGVAAMAGLFANSIIDVTASEDGTVILSFSNGDTLELRDDNKHYESYQIKHGNDLIVV